MASSSAEPAKKFQIVDLLNTFLPRIAFRIDVARTIAEWTSAENELPTLAQATDENSMNAKELKSRSALSSAIESTEIPLIFVHGPSGSGKTFLCLKELGKNFLSDAILCVNVNTGGSFQEFRRVACQYFPHLFANNVAKPVYPKAIMVDKLESVPNVDMQSWVAFFEFAAYLHIKVIVVSTSNQQLFENKNTIWHSFALNSLDFVELGPTFIGVARVLHCSNSSIAFTMDGKRRKVDKSCIATSSKIHSIIRNIPKKVDGISKFD